MRKRRLTVRKTKYLMQGGPLHGKTLYLACPGTLRFSMGGQTGHYDRGCRWVAVQ